MSLAAKFNALLVFILPLVFVTIAWKGLAFLGLVFFIVALAATNAAFKVPAVLLPLIGGIGLFFAAPVLGLPMLLNGYFWTGLYWAVCYFFIN